MLSGLSNGASRISTRASRTLAIVVILGALVCAASGDSRTLSSDVPSRIGAPRELARGQVLVPKRVRLIIGFVQTALA